MSPRPRYVPRVTGPEPKGKKQVTANVTPNQYERLERLAALRGTSRNAMVRYVLEKGLDAVEAEFSVGPKR